MSEDIQRRIREKISEIERKSADDNYIYRGEPEDHEEVSSNLWREYHLETEGFDIEAIQMEMLNGAKKHIGDLPQDLSGNPTGLLNVIQVDDPIDFEILTEIQHYGGNTNLIDFTTDYFIALFFACDGHHNEDGRVILQKTEAIQSMIEYPRTPRHRVIAQKSVFVRPPEGFIVPHEDDIVTIPADLKQWLLHHLRKYHGISTETIYNDLYGYIRSQDIHGDAYTWFYRGYASQNRWADATSFEERRKENEKSIEYFTQAIKLNPNLFEAYHNRGGAYIKMDRHDRAIRDFNEAIDSNPNHVESYIGRAFCRGMGGDYERAIEDCNRAIELDPNNSKAHSTRGVIYELKGDYGRALEDCNHAIELDSNNSYAYNARGVTYHKRDDNRSAIEDYTKAIELNANYVQAYYNRGEMRLHLEEWDGAKADLTHARDRGMDIIVAFNKEHGSVEDFQSRTGIIVPGDIAEMLTNTQS